MLSRPLPVPDRPAVASTPLVNFDGATSLSTSLDDPAPFADARTAAAELIDAGTRP